MGPNPCLFAILLTISTHSGPQFVYHYPPDINIEGFSTDTPLNYENIDVYNDDDDDEIDQFDDDSDEDSSVDEEPKDRKQESLLERLDKRKNGSTRAQSGDSVRRPPSTDFAVQRKTSIVESISSASGQSVSGQSIENSESHPWRTVLGFDTDFLSELLCPPREICNSKFEMTIDDVVFVGLPVHIRPDGRWKSPKMRDMKSAPSTLVRSAGRKSSLVSSNTWKNEEAESSSKAPERTADASKNDNYDDYDFNDDDDEDDEEEEDDDDENGQEESGEAKEAEYTDPNSPMRMFHVSFVMMPPATEYQQRIMEMFVYVLRNFVRCLKSEQARSNYVWNEVSTMLAERDRAMVDNKSMQQLYEQIREKSTLAVSINQLYEAISRSQIANVTLNRKQRSFQIPINTEFRSVPPWTEAGATSDMTSFLTSTPPFVNIVESDEGLSKHYAILLLDEPENIIRDIEVDPYSPLAAFIRSISPTQTLVEIADQSGWSFKDVVEFTFGLIYWRRARAIQPLHHRNAYIVSPLAPIGRLYEFIPKFRAKFPALPPLQRILSMLSTGRPRSFASHIPSRDHRLVYLNALAWLMRHGFVTQLQTFLWLKVTKQIKLRVLRDMQLAEEMKELDGGEVPVKNTDTSTDNTSRPQANVVFKLDENEKDTKAEEDSNQEGGKKAKENKKDEWVRFSTEESVIVDPERASSLEHKWLSKMMETQSPEVAKLFHRTMKYFNGRHSVEQMVLILGLSRQEVKTLLTALGDSLVIVRHW